MNRTPQVLYAKAQHDLSVREKACMEDVLYWLKMRFQMDAPDGCVCVSCGHARDTLTKSVYPTYWHLVCAVLRRVQARLRTHLCGVYGSYPPTPLYYTPGTTPRCGP